jgi:hypothetical protein
MLYYLFRQLADLLSFDSSIYRLYTDTFQACQQLYTYPDDFYIDLVANDLDTDSKDKSICDKSDNKLLADFEAFVYRQPGNDLTCSFTDNLGSCKLDCIYD